MKLLIITATTLEAGPLHEALELEPLPSVYGALYRARGLPRDVFLAHLGVGKVNTAAGLALALGATGAEAVLQLGIGGAFPGSGLKLGELALATHEVHLDSGLRDASGWHGMRTLGFPLLAGDPAFYNLFPTHPELLLTLEQATGARSGPFGTSETVTGSFDEARRLEAEHGVLIESMEGAAGAQVCIAMNVAFAELRGVSNTVGERDKRRWDIPAAVKAANHAALAVVRAAC